MVCLQDVIDGSVQLNEGVPLKKTADDLKGGAEVIFPKLDYVQDTEITQLSYIK